MPPSNYVPIFISIALLTFMLQSLFMKCNFIYSVVWCSNDPTVLIASFFLFIEMSHNHNIV